MVLPTAPRSSSKPAAKPSVHQSTGNLQVLPPWSSKPVASNNSLNNVADPASDRQLTVAAENSIIPVVYGRDRLGARIANVLSHGGYWVVQAVWCEGPIDAVESWTMGDKPPESGVLATHYLGLEGQGVDAPLAAAFAATGVSYTDTLPGIAYSVFRIPLAQQANFSFNAIIRGRLVYDYRTDTTAWSDNPALCLADFITNTKYGMGRTVDAASVIALANANDVLVDTEKSRTLNLTLGTAQDVFQWADVLRTYAGCWVLSTDTGLKLVPDAVRATSKVFDHDIGNIKSISALRKRPVFEAPTVMLLRYTNTTTLPWRDDIVTVYAPGVLAGTTPRRESEVPMPGIQSASMASREAIRRLNHLTLSDLSFSIEVYDDGLAVEVGDVVEVTHPIGLGSKPMRVVGVTITEVGRYTLDLTEYDPAAYSGSVITTPTFPDTNLPNAGLPTPPTNLVLTEEVFQQQDGTSSSRIRVRFDAPDFPFVAAYRIVGRSGGEIVFTGDLSPLHTSWASPPVQELVSYQVDVSTVSILSAESAVVSDVILAQGKFLAPGNVPSLDGFEVGGQVRLRWDPAVDIDIWRYEVRYVAVGGTWAAGILIDRVDALTLVTTIVPVGSWDLMVKAIDSVGNYSATEARRTLTVTLDDGAYLADTYDYDTPALTNMLEYRLGRLDTKRRFVTSSAATWNDTFGSNMSTYTNPVLSYFSATSQFLTESHDYGLMLAGNWQSEMVVADVFGSHTKQMEISPDNIAWDDYPTMVTKTGGRFSRLRANTTGVMRVELPLARTRIDAIPRTESGASTSLSSGGKTITLVNEFAAAKTISVTPMGTASRVAVVDNLVMGSPSSFDVYIFDAGGTQVAAGFMWSFEGV